MKSMINELPEGASVTFRTIQTRTVETVYGHPDLHFSAVTSDHDPNDDSCEFYNRAMIADWDLSLVKRGARFWLLIEQVRTRDGRMEQQSAIAFQHPGVVTAEEAFTARPSTGGDD